MKIKASSFSLLRSGGLLHEDPFLWVLSSSVIRLLHCKAVVSVYFPWTGRINQEIVSNVHSQAQSQTY